MYRYMYRVFTLLSYTAPTDDALAYDVEVLETFGLNMIR